MAFCWLQSVENSWIFLKLLSAVFQKPLERCIGTVEESPLNSRRPTSPAASSSLKYSLKYSPADVYKRQARQLLDRPDRPTAVFCISDVLAMGAIRAAGGLGIRVPEELSVVGFDDVEYATMMNPMLTTVSQPLYPLGKTSARMLIDQIESGEGKGKIFLEHKLVIRDSTAQLEP